MLEIIYNSLELRLFGKEEINSVSLRELYLDLGYDEVNFNAWVKRNLIEDFDEGIDWTRLFLEKESNQGGKEKQDYIITLDIAKQLAMMSKKPKGKQIRKYFIEVEKEFRKSLEMTPLQHMEKANKMLLEENIQHVKREARNKKLINSLNIIEASAHDTGTTMQIEEFCKIITDVVEGSLLGRTKAYIVLRSMNFIMTKVNHPTQQVITRGYLNYVKHGRGYMVVLYVNKANRLIKLMAKHLQDNEGLNLSLNYPFQPDLRVVI